MPTFHPIVAVGVGVAIALSFIEPGASKDLPPIAQPRHDQAESPDSQPTPALAQNVLTQSPKGSTAQASAQPENPVSAEIRVNPEHPKAAGTSADTLKQPTASVAGDPQGMPASVREYLGKPFSPLGEDSFVQAPAPQPSPTAPVRSSPEYLNPSANPLLFPTRSQEVQIQTTQPITLQEAIGLARRNNLDLQQSQIQLERARAQLRQAQAALYPTADLETGLTNTGSGQSGLLNTNTSSTAFNAGLQLGYDIYTGGLRSSQIRAAQEGVRLQELQVEQVSEQLRLDTTTAYYALQQAGAQVEIAQAAVVDAAQSLRDAQLREQAGLGTRFDVLQAQVQLSAANQDLTTAISNLRTSRRQIVQVLNLAQTVDVAAADPIEVAGEWNLSLEQSIVLALKNRAELEAQLVQRNISEQNRQAALASIRPQVGITASYNIRDVLNDNRGFGDTYSIGPTIRWRLFDAGEARARAEQQSRNIELAETNFANQRNQVRFDVEQSFFDLNANAQNIQTASFALTQAQESLRLARLRFQAGVGTQTDVINQQTALTNARGRLLTAILNYNRALAQLQRSVSNLPDSNLFVLP
ncbi:MAG TPA: TolC family protein [Chroococcales cyanobacterium]|jgi:outer membrane protein TolC